MTSEDQFIQATLSFLPRGNCSYSLSSIDALVPEKISEKSDTLVFANYLSRMQNVPSAESNLSPVKNILQSGDYHSELAGPGRQAAYMIDSLRVELTHAVLHSYVNRIRTKLEFPVSNFFENLIFLHRFSLKIFE